MILKYRNRKGGAEMFKVYYQLQTVYDDETYYPIQNRLLELLNQYNWRFTAQEKKEFIEELKKIEGLQVVDDGGKNPTLNQANFVHFLEEFLDSDNIVITTRKHRVRGKVVSYTHIRKLD